MSGGNTSKVMGATLLLAGSCIGAGMLGLPLVTGLSGFVPAVVAFIIGWAFFTTTALLLLEVNVWVGKEVSLVTMAGRTLGRVGQALSWILFCYLFYLLLVAYSAGSGALVADFWEDWTGERIPQWIGSLGCSVVFGVLVYFGTRAVDYVNRVLMLGLAVSYVLLIVLGLPEVRGEFLARMEWLKAGIGLPVIVIGFGLHNMIPSITRYLDGNLRALRKAVIMGTTIPLVLYLLWEVVILGIIPAQKLVGGGDLVSTSLRAVSGYQWVTIATEYFSFFAIITSFLAQALSLLHFLMDGFHTPNKRIWRVLLTLLAVAPPFVAAIYKPRAFVEALELAGAFGAVILFGILPALMVWIGRYWEGTVEKRAIGGGKPLLVVVILFSLFVIALQLFRQMGIYA